MSAIETLSVQMQVGAWSICETKVEMMDVNGCVAILIFNWDGNWDVVFDVVNVVLVFFFLFRFFEADQVLELVRCCPAT